MTLYDVAIVGAGPAGLFACHEITRLHPEASVVLIDRGPDLETRLAGEQAPGSDWLTGFGGAGFFIGGRMSFDLDAPTGRPKTMDREQADELRGYVDCLLTEWGSQAPIQSGPPAPLAAAAKTASDVGLTWHLNYPARHLSPEERQSALTALRAQMTSGTARVLTGTTLERIERAGRIWRLHTAARSSASSGGQAKSLHAHPDRAFHEDQGRDTGSMTLSARKLLLAPGRAGAGWLADTLAEAGARVSRESSVGIRVEAPTGVLEPLTNLTPDPRLSLALQSGRFRTYAFAVGGHVILTQTEAGARIGVAPGRDRRSPNTSFAVLWEAVELEVEDRAREPGMATLVDLDIGSQQTFDCASPIPTLAVPRNDIRSHWPSAFWTGVEEFLRRLDMLAPGIDCNETLAYSPAAETVWRYRLDEDGETELPGLYLAGDGAGISQGAMAAAISGVAVGRAIMAPDDRE